jgi:hypothetical protein
MERPGLLEIGVYMLVLAGAASWVYGLPPFDYEPGSARHGEVRPLAATTTSDPAESEDETASGQTASGQTASEQSASEQSASEQSASEQPSPEASQAASQDTFETVSQDMSQDVAQNSSDRIASPPDEADEQPRLDRQSNLLMVTATRLNMRSEPNANSALVGSYSRGALVEELSTSGNWVLVRTVEDESTGWMYAGFLGNVTDN